VKIEALLHLDLAGSAAEEGCEAADETGDAQK
jgi:hypothetical protein